MLDEDTIPESQIEYYRKCGYQNISGAAIVPILINELEKAQEMSMCFSALGIALILPDMCSKVEFGKKSHGTEYKKWVDKYVVPLVDSNDEHSMYTIVRYKNGRLHIRGNGVDSSCEDIEESYSAFSGEAIYGLRCSFFHEGVPNVKKVVSSESESIDSNKSNSVKRTINYRINLDEHNINSSNYGFCQTICPNDAATEYDIVEEISFDICAQEICDYIRIAASKYYKDNKDKFDTLSYSIHDKRKSHYTPSDNSALNNDKNE